MSLSICPRCQSEAYEVLRTHSYCLTCNYSPTFEDEPTPNVPQWALDMMHDGIDADDPSMEFQDALSELFYFPPASDLEGEEGFGDDENLEDCIGDENLEDYEEQSA